MAKLSSRRPHSSTIPESKRAQEDLSYTILLTKQVRKSASEATSFKSECAFVARQAARLSQLLRSAIRLITSSGYSRPILRIATGTSVNLQLALTLTRNCRHGSFLRRVIMVNHTSPGDFRRLTSLLDTCVANLRWLLSIFNSPTSTTSTSTSSCSSGSRDTDMLSLPPIASTDPILAWVWTFLATVHNTTNSLPDRIHAADELASLALESDHNKKIIVEEGGVPALLKLLKEHTSNDAQITAATALFNLMDVKTETGEAFSSAADSIADSYVGIPLIVQIFISSPMKVQIKLAKLVAKMSEFSPNCKEKFAVENVIRPLVSLLSFETFEDEEQKLRLGKQHSFHYSIVHQINNNDFTSLNLRGTTTCTDQSSNCTLPSSPPRNGGRHHHINQSSRPRLFSSSSFPTHRAGSTLAHQRKLERENETPEVKREMKITCSEALLMLARDSVGNSKRITETKGLLCLVKLMEKEDGDDGELKRNCLMTIMEIAKLAESNADLRRSGFKNNSPAVKGLVCQLLRLIKQKSALLMNRVLAIRSIGCLARTFPAREAARVIESLVDRLNEEDEVVTEAVVALWKFTMPGNYLCKENSKSIIEFNGVPKLMRLVKGEVSAVKMLHALTVLCYVVMYASEDEALGESQVLGALEEAAVQAAVVQGHPRFKGLISRAVEQLRVYHDVDDDDHGD